MAFQMPGVHLDIRGPPVVQRRQLEKSLAPSLGNQLDRLPCFVFEQDNGQNLVYKREIIVVLWFQPKKLVNAGEAHLLATCDHIEKGTEQDDKLNHFDAGRNGASNAGKDDKVLVMPGKDDNMESCELRRDETKEESRVS